jgi:2,4-dienoyl-CoA reductase-like NADH-dependent reductase (Old Yellow Enzyme family)/thioredoxin reductase
LATLNMVNMLPAVAIRWHYNEVRVCFKNNWKGERRVKVTDRRFPKLFEPGQIGNVRIRNRIVMLPMGTCYAGPYGEVSAKTIDYYTERAKGGTGLITIGYTFIFPRPGSSGLDLSHDRFLSGHFELIEAIHAYGAKVTVQLVHIGRVWPSHNFDEYHPVSCSDRSVVYLGETRYPTPRPLERGEIYALMDKFAAAAERAMKVGYDMVEIHAAHGYLLGSFLSRFTNNRKDEFGGSLGNRLRFPLGVIKRIKDAVGNDFPVGIRFSADEFLGDEGIDIKESPIMAQEFEKAGVAYISISTGTHENLHKSDEIGRYEEGWKSYIWEAITKAVGVPTIAAGGLKTPAYCEDALAKGNAHFIGMARAVLAEPHWANRTKEGKLDDIRPCISCLECLRGSTIGRRQGGNARRCTVNVALGREREFTELKSATLKKKVMIVGGGPGGMEAARVAAQRGHNVTLYEKSQDLGGQLIYAAKTVGKYRIDNLRNYLINQMRKAGVKVELGKEVTPKLVQEVKPDVVILATGSEPCIPNIPGTDTANITNPLEVLSEKVTLKGQNVVVVGGGATGSETAEYLADRGCKVTLVEMLPKMGLGMEPMTRKGLLDALYEKGVTMLNDREVVRISDKNVEVINKNNGKREAIERDWVVLATGMKPVQKLANELEGEVTELYCIGDCNRWRLMIEAIFEGSQVARVI